MVDCLIYSRLFKCTYNFRGKTSCKVKIHGNARSDIWEYWNIRKWTERYFNFIVIYLSYFLLYGFRDVGFNSVDFEWIRFNWLHISVFITINLCNITVRIIKLVKCVIHCITDRIYRQYFSLNSYVLRSEIWQMHLAENSNTDNQ